MQSRSVLGNIRRAPINSRPTAIVPTRRSARITPPKSNMAFVERQSLEKKSLVDSDLPVRTRRRRAQDPPLWNDPPNWTSAQETAPQERRTRLLTPEHPKGPIRVSLAAPYSRNPALCHPGQLLRRLVHRTQHRALHRLPRHLHLRGGLRQAQNGQLRPPEAEMPESGGNEARTEKHKTRRAHFRRRRPEIPVLEIRRRRQSME